MSKNTVWASFAFEPFTFVHDDFEFNPLHLPRVGEGVYMHKYKPMLKEHYKMTDDIVGRIDDIYIVSAINWEDLEDGVVHIDLRPLDYLQKPLSSTTWNVTEWEEWLDKKHGNNHSLS